MTRSAIAATWTNSSGATGISASLRTFSAFGVHGASIVTGVATPEGIKHLPEALIDGQVIGALGATGAAPAAVGLSGNAGLDLQVISKLADRGLTQVVLDAGSCPWLATIGNEQVELYRTQVLPKILLLLTDIAGAQALARVKIANQTAVRAVAKLLHRLGPKYVLIAGDQLPGDEANDIMFDGEQNWEYPAERIVGPAVLDMSATYGAAIAAGLAHERSTAEAVAVARIYVTDAQRAAYSLGSGLTASSQMHAWWTGGGAQGYGG